MQEEAKVDSPGVGTCCNKRCKGIGAPSLKWLCMRCHKEAKVLVESGRATWDGLADLGLCKLPPKEEDTSFLAAFNAAIENSQMT